MKNVLNGILVVLGFISLGLGMIGIFLPILPTTPFLLLAAAFFARGSKRFHIWFSNTKIYKNYLEETILNRKMTKENKRNVLIMVTLLLSAGMIFSPGWIIKSIIFVILLCHWYFFLFRIRTFEKEENNKDKSEVDEV